MLCHSVSVSKSFELGVLETPEFLVFVGIYFGVALALLSINFCGLSKVFKQLRQFKVVTKQRLGKLYWTGTQMFVVVLKFQVDIISALHVHFKLAAPIRAMSSVAALIKLGISKASYGTLSCASTSFSIIETIGITPFRRVDCTRWNLMSFNLVLGLSLSQLRWFTFVVSRCSQFSGLLYRFCVSVITMSKSFSLIKPNTVFT